MLLRGTFLPQVAAQCAFFGRTFFSENLARIFSSGSQNLQKIPGKFLAPFELSRSFTCPACLSILSQSGDIQVLEKCKHLSGIDMSFTNVQGTAECSSVFGAPVRFFWKKFLLSESCANFLEWLAELAKKIQNFSFSFRPLSYLHLPALLSIMPSSSPRGGHGGPTKSATELQF